MIAAPSLVTHEGTHGVAVYGRQLAGAIAARRLDVRVIDVAHEPGVPAGRPVHVQFTDRLWGGSPESAAERVTALAERRPVTVTLHDLPQPSDGPRNLPRRQAAYAAVAAAARAVAVNSDHELALLGEADIRARSVTSIPLPVDVAASTGAGLLDGTVGVLGFFYPGKGHDEVALAAAQAGIPRMTVLGRASDGHATDLETFVRRAHALDVEVEVTGWLDDAELARRGRTVSVPVVAHRHVSASGSLATWIGWGRRPVAERNCYVDEMARLRPGTLHTVHPADLAAALRLAAGDPASTRHGLDTVPFSLAEVADAYLSWWDDLR
ncbi:hypothetical protein FBY40_3242 [Microbacterium sp. SLBN-154]|uniref:hypothetical protein n=1 Tax=Microbacterium sp. SLBN-154 TaxID=2768458 RepID=UPI00116712CD|nr:hypothetical protein [Microbacterium sp. SLBN-154]TQK20702.1 hypothetical protein FBY40_3242 [Microbacterium sp. SLBN-154]